MGWIGAMGSVGRIVGPIVSGFMWEEYGQSQVMIFGTLVSTLSLFVSLLLFIRFP